MTLTDEADLANVTTEIERYGDAANPYGRAFAIGAVAGLRSMLAPAAVHLEARDRATVILGLAALGELIADKLPAVPSRISPPSLVVRAASGAYCGRALAVRFGGSALAGAIAGACGAVASSYVGYGSRKAITTGTSIPDLPVALVEDAIAIASAVGAQRRPPDLSI